MFGWGGPIGEGPNEFGSPRAFTLQGNDVYVADRVFNSIKKYTLADPCPAGTTPVVTGVCFVIKWGSLCALLFGGTGCVDPDGPGPLELGDGQFDRARGVAVDNSGNIYVADSDNSRIQKFMLANPCPLGTNQLTPGVCFVTKWGTVGTAEGQFSGFLTGGGPGYIAVDSLGDLYVPESGNRRIQKFTFANPCPAGTTTIVAGVCFVVMWGWGVKDGSNTFQACTNACQAGISGSGDGQFNVPVGIALDNLDNMYIGETGNQRIQKFVLANPCPAMTTELAAGICFAWKLGTPGSGDGQFNVPQGLSVDAAGRVYVSERDNFRVQVFAPSPSQGTIIVKKLTNPSPDPTNTSFNFTAGGGLSPTNFSLKNGEMQMFNNVPVGSGYSISETVSSGWDLTSATCDDGSPVTNINLSAGETVICTFTNTAKPPITATKEATNLATNSLTVFRAGDTIQYTVVINNPSGSPLNNHAGPEFTDQIISAAVVPNSGATASSGTISYDSGTRTYSWDGSIPTPGSVTLSFSVRILSGLIGTVRVCNKGTVFVDSSTQVMTSDPTPLSGAPEMQTCVDITGRPELFCYRLACLLGAIELSGIKEINLQVYSLSGKRVYASGWVKNGHEWNLQNKDGRKVANGVYLYVMTTRGYDGTVRTQVKKLVIQR